MLSMLLGLSPQSLHQPHHPLASTTHPASLQGRVNTWTPINLAILQENRLDFGRKPGIFSLVSANGPFAPGRIATHRYRHRPCPITPMGNSSSSSPTTCYSIPAPPQTS